jgi:hypothetical protein
MPEAIYVSDLAERVYEDDLTKVNDSTSHRA